MITANEAVLTVTALTKEYGGVAAVADVTTSFRAGTYYGLIGPNGAGKTTLFNLVSGFTRPTSGRVEWAGRDITKTPPARRAALGMVRSFQHARTLHGLTVYDHLRVAAHLRGGGGFLSDLVPLGASRRSERRLAEIADELIDCYELGPIARRLATELPYGMTKRLGIVMALACRPRLLLLDEPAAGLNNAEIYTLRTDLERARSSGMGVVVVEHHMGFVMDISEKVIVLDAGRVIAEGRPSDVVNDERVATAYLGRRR